MRYYPSFLKAIPHTWAGYSRVTHPSATRALAEARLAFDLHVLGTPPAFVLSQDQTRHPSFVVLSIAASPPTPSRATSSQIHVIPLACCCVVCTTQRTLTYATRIVTVLGNSWHCNHKAHTAASHSSVVQVHCGGDHRAGTHAPDAKESISQRRAQVKRVAGLYPHSIHSPTLPMTIGRGLLVLPLSPGD